jgi:hypothetical protein
MRHAPSVVSRFPFLGLAFLLAACSSNATVSLTPQAGAPAATIAGRSVGASPLGSGQIVQVGMRWQAPWNLAVDRHGDVYVTDLPTGKLFRVAPPFTGRTHGKISKVGVYYWYPWSVAVDNDDNAYVSEGAPYVGWFIYQESRTGVESVVAKGAYFTGVAVDAHQNVYAAADTSVIFRILRIHGGWQIPVRYGPKFKDATSVAVDAADDVYVTDSDANQVKMIEPGGKIVTVGSGYDYPTSVAVDRYCKTACAVYVADTNHNAIEVVTPPFTGPTHGKVGVIGHGFWQPWGVAAKGNDVYVADTNHHSVKEVMP